jgi:hypothetical protein
MSYLLIWVGGFLVGVGVGLAMAALINTARTHP